MHRKIPVLKRLVPSISKRAAALLPKRRPGVVRLVGIPPAPTLHIFGDSHTGLYEKSVPRDALHYIGPLTMHRVGRDGVPADWIPRIRTGEALGFVFGEIDVRVHIANQRDHFFRNPIEIIGTLATKYLRALEGVQKIFTASPIIVFSVVPPAGRRHPNFDHQYPRNGTDQERVAWTKQLNETLRRGALHKGFGFVDQYQPFANPAGLLDRRMTADGVHVTLRKDVELLCTLTERVWSDLPECMLCD